TASRRVLDGIVPVFRHTPPSIRGRSTIATLRSSLAAAIAAFWPPGPDPMTTRSNSCTLPVWPRLPAFESPYLPGRAVNCHQRGATARMSARGRRKTVAWLHQPRRAAGGRDAADQCQLGGTTPPHPPDQCRAPLRRD